MCVRWWHILPTVQTNGNFDKIFVGMILLQCTSVVNCQESESTPQKYDCCFRKNLSLARKDNMRKDNMRHGLAVSFSVIH